MRKLLLVGRREFRQRVTSRGFIISSVLIPLLFIIFWGIALGSEQGAVEAPASEAVEQIESRLGYVDQADLIAGIPESVQPGTVTEYEDIESATAALEDGRIQAYYIIPADYRQTGELRRVSLEMPTLPADVDAFNWILVSNLVPGVSSREAAQLQLPMGADGPQFVDLSAEVETSPGQSFTPYLVTLAIMLPLFTGGGYLLQSLIQEKSSRVIEILLVSLRPSSLLGGKLVGLGFLILVQYLIWAVIVIAAIIVTGQDMAGILTGINISASELVLMVPYALGGFILYAGIMAGIGALSPDIEGSRLWIFLISLPMLTPLYLWAPITSDPNGSLATVISLIPFSAPIAMLLRMTATIVPQWQLVVSLVLLFLTGVAIVWLMARLFRAQTLLSGESFSLRRFIGAMQAG